MGELEGCWATPSTVSPQAPRLPALPLLQATGTQAAWGLGAQSSPPISAVFLQDAVAKYWSQPVPRNGACWLLGSEWAGSGGCWGLGGDPGKWCCLSYILSCSLPPGTGCSGLWSFACAVGGACGASEPAAFPKDCLRTPGRCPSPTQLARTSQAVGRQ